MTYSDQDQLADVLKREGDRESSIGFYRNTFWLPIAERLITKGWRPPARVVEIVEELDALRDLSVAFRNNVPYTKWEGSWFLAGQHHRYTSASLLLNGPVTVLHEPPAPPS